MKAIRNWWNELIYEEYELTVWFDGGCSEDKEGNLNQKKFFHLKVSANGHQLTSKAVNSMANHSRSELSNRLII